MFVVGYLLRGPYLARFELCSKLIKQGIDSTDLLGETIELFIEYFRKFGHKPCCVSDLRVYLYLLDSERKSELSNRLIKDVGISSTSVPQSVRTYFLIFLVPVRNKFIVGTTNATTSLFITAFKAMR